MRIKPDVFNSYFVDSVKAVRDSIGTPEVSAQQFLNAVPKPEAAFSLRPVSCEEVLEIVGELKSSNSRDFFGMSVNLIKSVIMQILIPLNSCLNACITEGVFPTVLKIAKTIPVHKKGSFDMAGNFRPISILPVFSKILESIIKKQLCWYLRALVCL
ncbi:uncharacterized protein LOC120356318 [Nilaparvata lugens]|uniref:uncharacterized protein LOC120356318 n=1 Tax=Nilaparvata lugens TaxID=108931 RepID=UPI00193DD43B|nr:uncharacterized protein LOC120356318 [Nilaparvata lugens]